MDDPVINEFKEILREYRNEIANLKEEAFDYQEKVSTLEEMLRLERAERAELQEFVDLVYETHPNIDLDIDRSERSEYIDDFDQMDGDHESALRDAGWGTDEDYGYYGEDSHL